MFLIIFINVQSVVADLDPNAVLFIFNLYFKDKIIITIL